MISITILLGMLCAGVILGLFYFGGLWLTLDRFSETRRWGLWLGASFLLRSTMVVICFWFLSAGDWQRILALAAGFTLVRFFSLKRMAPKPLQTS